jgi:uncharacterized protein
MTVDIEQRNMLPSPGWSEHTKPYWFAAGRGELVIPRCNRCGTHRWPLDAACYVCHATEFSWSQVPGTGRVFTFTWVDSPPPPDGERNITVVELDGTQGEPVRVLSWVVDIQRESLACDQPVEIVFLTFDDEVSIPAWRPRR